MIKPKIGAVLCILSSLAAAVLYFGIDLKFAESWLTLQDLRFLRLYFPILFILDLILLLNICVRAFVKRKTNCDPGKRTVLEKIVTSRILEAVIFEAYVALNLFIALKFWKYSQQVPGKKIIEIDFYVPLLYIKTVFFAALYHMQALFSFRKRKFWMRMLAIHGIVILGYLVYARLQTVIVTEKLDIDLTISIYYQLYRNKTWPESRYWMSTALIVGLECILPTVRLIGLALYNTRYHKPRHKAAKGKKTDEIHVGGGKQALKEAQ